MVEIGTYQELLASSSAFAQLLEDINQHEQEQKSRTVSFINQQSIISSINSEKEDGDDDINPLATNLETKQEGSVKWNIYVSYLRAGVGMILGVVLIVLIFSMQQGIAMYSNWWLAAWSNEESRRHQNSTNCAHMREKKTDGIDTMSESEWNRHRNHRFYTFCGS